MCVHNEVDPTWPSQLIDYLQTINTCFESMKLPCLDIGNPLDQQFLNSLHRQWVKFHLDNPKIIALLRLKNSELVTKFRGINKLLHKTEKMFSQCYLGQNEDQVINMHNPFHNALSFSTANLQLYYHDLGRNTFNKWINFDEVLDDGDTNDYVKLSADVQLNLGRSLQQQAPTNYLEWCQKHGLSSAPGRWVNLGNFVDLETQLTSYRELLMRNLHSDILLVQ